VGWFDDSSSGTMRRQEGVRGALVSPWAVCRPYVLRRPSLHLRASSEQGGQAGVFLVAARIQMQAQIDQGSLRVATFRCRT